MPGGAGAIRAPGGTLVTEYGTTRDLLSRRHLLRRGAVVGGALLWTVPAVQSIPTSALAAQGSLPTNTAGSYVYVFLRSTLSGKRRLYVVKYGDSPANPASDKHIGADEPLGRAFYAAVVSQAAKDGFARSGDAFTAATVVGSASSLRLRIDEPACWISAWFVHDGTYPAGQRFASSVTRVVRNVAVGPEVPAARAVFSWQRYSN